MSDVPVLVVDEEKVKKCVRSSIPLTVTTYTLPHDVEIYITKLLASFLRCVGHEELQDYLQYCVQELAVNAKKANTKRIYFLEKNCDLSDPEQYADAMQNFKKDTLGNLEHYLKLLKEKGYYIKVVFICKSDSIIIEIRNNVLISKIELMRIYDKLARSREYNSMADAFNQVLDDSEGAGLGIVVLVLMLKKMGLDDDCFEITTNETETIARITIPLEHAKAVNISNLTSAVVESVNSLPHFPENILAVQKLASDPDSDMSAIARQISVDPAMTADIIKVVNSPVYFMKDKVDNIAEAVTILGIKGIKNLLYSYGTQKILGDDTIEKRKLWEHSYRAAFYAYNIVKNFSKDKNVLDDSYVCGMLHDMGKIVFSSIAPDLTKKMALFCDEKDVPQVLFEDISAGMNHAEIGALIAEKWNFPANLVAAIRFHHDPLSSPKEFHSLVYAIYFANMLCELELKNVVFEQFDMEVLKSFSITTKKQVDSILQRLSAVFRR